MSWKLITFVGKTIIYQIIIYETIIYLITLCIRFFLLYKGDWICGGETSYNWNINRHMIYNFQVIND